VAQRAFIGPILTFDHSGDIVRISAATFMPSKPSRELTKCLLHFDPAIRKLTLALRALVIEELAPCYENIYDAYNALALGYGTSDRLRDGICHVAVYAKHVNLGFNEGSSLSDPQRLFRGTGKRIRHITIKSLEDVKQPALREYLRRARKHAGHEVRRAQSAKVVSTLKATYPVRRRPDGIHRS